VICDTYLSVSTPAQIAAPRLLERGADVRAQIAGRVAGNYRRICAAIASASGCRVLRADGGWYAVVQVPSIEPEEDLVVRLLTTDGVLTHPGYFFDFAREAYLVISLLAEPTAFAEGVARIIRHFDCRLAGSTTAS